MTKSKKVVKAWAIYSKKLGDLGETFYESKRRAQDCLRMGAYHKNPLIMKKAMSAYRVIPVTITYSLTKTKK